MKKILSFLVLAPLVGLGQGVNFENGLSWQQIVAKAKTENKYIFVDCYASWCGPCKMMDREVYPNDSVGEVMNAHFVSVKAQMDTSIKDDESIKAWYADAHMLRSAYKVNAFPTFLFFTSDGKIVHRGLAFKKPIDFVKLAVDAQDPRKQYFTLVRQYRMGIHDLVAMRYLLQNGRNFIDPEVANGIAVEYLHSYLDKLNDDEICTKENLEFMGQVASAMTSKDKVFQCFFHHGELADSVMGDKEYAKWWINYLVTKEAISPVIKVAESKGRKPDWGRIERNIKRKFGPEYVEANIVRAKVPYFKSMKDWTDYTKCLVMEMDMTGLQNVRKDMFGMMSLNHKAWEIFQYSDNKEELEKAVSWEEKAIEMLDKPYGGFLDTKANLLYKLGKKDEAIALETKAAELSPKIAEIPEALRKMQNGEPTWATR